MQVCVCVCVGPDCSLWPKPMMLESSYYPSSQHILECSRCSSSVESRPLCRLVTGFFPSRLVGRRQRALQRIVFAEVASFLVVSTLACCISPGTDGGAYFTEGALVFLSTHGFPFCSELYVDVCRSSIIIPVAVALFSFSSPL